MKISGEASLGKEVSDLWRIVATKAWRHSMFTGLKKFLSVGGNS